MKKRIRRRSISDQQEPEDAWGKMKTASAISRSARVALLIVTLISMVTLVIVFWPAEVRKAVPNGSEMEVKDGVATTLDAAQKVASAFLAEADPEKRLKWVKNAEEVGTRLSEYPDEPRSAVGEIERVLGHQVDDGLTVTGFVVAFPSGNVRLLEVVGMPDEPRVDWDAYARYGTASWEDLLSGKAESAEVRVFCEPSSERPEPFGDQGKWTCFRLSSPELPQTMLGFADVGSVRDKMMKQVILGTPDYRQRFVLEIVRREGKEEPLFEIRRCMAVGWILGEKPVE